MASCPGVFRPSSNGPQAFDEREILFQEGPANGSLAAAPVIRRQAGWIETPAEQS